LSWLLSRDYSLDSALKLVGDRYRLVKRQRVAVRRAAASDQAVTSRTARCIAASEAIEVLVIDGFNLIVTIESALSGGVLLRCRDGAIRDLASVHGSYRKVEETIAAIDAVAMSLEPAASLAVRWLLDRPVSNSGRLASILREHAGDAGRDWTVDLVDDADAVLTACPHPVVTSDSHILDGCGNWVNLADRVISRLRIDPWVVDLA
jgi:hypothetical protein